MNSTCKERRVAGKALRDKCAKDAHATWKPHAERDWRADVGAPRRRREVEPGAAPDVEEMK